MFPRALYFTWFTCAEFGSQTWLTSNENIWNKKTTPRQKFGTPRHGPKIIVFRNAIIYPYYWYINLRIPSKEFPLNSLSCYLLNVELVKYWCTTGMPLWYAVADPGGGGLGGLNPPSEVVFGGFLLVSIWKFPRTWTLNPPFEEFWTRIPPLKNS